MAYIDPDDYWAHVQSCSACGMVIPPTEEGILDHAAHHFAEYERLFVWPVFVYEDALDAEFTNDEDRLNEANSHIAT